MDLTLDQVVDLVLFASITGALVMMVARRVDLVAPAAVGLVIRLVVAIGIYLAAGLVSPDARVYDATAYEPFAEDDILPVAKIGWPLVLAGIYAIYGHNPTIGLALNAAAGGGLVIAVGLVARRLGLPDQLAAWLAALHPLAIFWSSLLLRESMIWMTSIVLVLGLVGLARRHRPVVDGALFLAGFAGLLWFRGSLAVGLAAAGLVAVAISRRAWLPLATGAVAVAVLFVSPLGGPLRSLVGEYSPAQLYAGRWELSTTADSGFPIDNFADIAARVLLGPAPWEWPQMGLALAGDVTLWLSIASFAVVGAFAMKDRRGLIVILLPVIALLGVLVITMGNYGTLARLRLQPALMLLPLTAYGPIVVRDRLLRAARVSRSRRVGAR